MEVYTTAEVSKHHEAGDLWVSIRGKVYNVTSYVDDHPGGIEVLKDVAGSDGTESFEYVGHSKDAYKVLETFQIGVLEGDTQEQAVEKLAPGWEAYRSQARSKTPAKVDARWSVVATLMLVVGVASRWRSSASAAAEETGFVLISPESSLSTLASFWVGVLAALAMSMCGYLYMYAKFTKTLEYYKEVWEYPSYFSCKVNRADI